MPKLELFAGDPEEKQAAIAKGVATHNPSVWLICIKADRIVKELTDSRTGNNVTGNKFDMARTLQFIADLKLAKKYLLDEPELDWVQTHPDTYKLPTEPSLNELENEDVLFALNDLNRARRELVRSNTTREPSGIRKNDSTRFDTFIGKLEKFVNDYIGKKIMGSTGEVDYVESSNKVPNQDSDDGTSTRTA